MVKFKREGFSYIFEVENGIEETLIQKSLTIKNPGARYVSSFKMGIWDGNNRFYSGNKFDHGHLHSIKKLLKENNINYEVNNNIDEVLVKDEILNPILHQHQKEAIKVFFKRREGIVMVPTRGGKTFIASECIRLYSELVCYSSKILFIVDTVDLFNQAVDDISGFLKIEKDEIGQLRGSELFTPKKINVATIQTICGILFFKTKSGEKKEAIENKKIRRVKLQTFLEKVGFLIVDEVHEYSSDFRIHAIKNCKNLKMHLSLSATPYKSNDDLANMAIRGITGDIIYEVEEETLTERGVLAKNDVFLVIFEKFKNIKHSNTEKSKYNFYFDQYIIHNDQRNELILFVIKLLRKLRIKSLVLFSSKEHGNLIAEKSGCLFLSGDDQSDKRVNEKKKFLGGGGKVLLASKIFNKGITLPEVQVMVNVNGGSEKANIKQKKGRVLGTTKGKKKAIIMDIIDMTDKYFTKHAMNRVEVYKENHDDDQIKVFYHSEDDFKELLEQELIRYFEKEI